MNDYKSKKIEFEKPYRQMQFHYDQIYKRLIRQEENEQFWSKYCRLNEQLKAEEQY